jgi:eukaryotic-like serine/threonine-protein kinase
MDANRWQHLKELFEAAMECSGAARPALLDRLCAGDLSLRRDLEQLLGFDAEAGAFLEGGVSGLPYSLPDGTVLAGRLRIVRALGRGGMGEVYEAYNQHARQAEALKVLRPEFARDADAVARLVQEVRASRQVTHPNVCRVYDIDRAVVGGREILFLTMELVSGETLAERLRRAGAMTAPQALSVARQIAQALDAAHAAGVVHRDFKCANVMLEGADPSCRAVVMDFGLARRTNVPGQSLTSTGMIVGTPAYMAPEQMEGGEAGPPADRYAFGVVLHEMRTGSTHVSGAEPLDRAWADAIDACLERDPVRRPSSAAEIIRRLEPRRRRFRFGRQAAAAVLVAAVALLLWIYRIYDRRDPAAAGSIVMLTPVRNTTADPNLDAVTEVLRTQLRQSGHFRLWDSARQPAILERMAWPSEKPLADEQQREVAARDSVPFVVFGNVASVGGDFELSLRLDQLGAATPLPRRTWRQTFHAPGKAGIHDALHDGAKWLRSTLGEAPTDIAAHDRMPQETTSSSWAALAAYAAAERLRQKRDSESAIATLREALRLDPDFALARMRLGDLLVDQRKQQEGLAEWQLALSAAGVRRLTRREELLIQGSYANDTWDFPAAEAAFVQMEAEYPHEYLASFYLAHALQWQGRFEAAAERMEAAARKQSGSGPVWSNLASMYLCLRRYDALDRVIAELAALPRPTAADRYRGLKNFALGSFDEALAAFDRCAGSPDPVVRSRGFSEKAALLAELGRYAEARAALAAGLSRDGAGGRPALQGGNQLALAYLALREGRAVEARSLAWNAAARDSGSFGVLRAAILLARSGDAAGARDLAARLAGFAPGSVYNRLVQSRIRGEELLASGNAVAALAEFRKTAALDPAIRPRDYLARALVAAGQHAESLPHWRAIADTPELLWQSVDFDFPGLQTDALFEYATAAVRAGQPGQAQSALKQYLVRRGASPHPEVRAAKLLARQVGME